MKVAFITESNYMSKVPSDMTNMRTEYSWIHALDAMHYPITRYTLVKDYDLVIIIWPKLKIGISSDANPIGIYRQPVLQEIFANNIVNELKERNKYVAYMQEGPSWFMTDYEIQDQFNLFKRMEESDIIFCHNQYDMKWYEGLFPNKEVYPMPTLMIEELIKDIVPTKEDKTIIGGNFARWYGGFQSYYVASHFNNEIWTMTSHAMREGEDQIPNLKHLPRLWWNEWMQELSTFKYAVHLMPTAAAGTFSLNCAFFGVPCIGNIKIDTQRICFPKLSIDVDDIESARELAIRLKEDEEFYNACSVTAKEKYRAEYDIDVFQKYFKHIGNKFKLNG